MQIYSVLTNKTSGIHNILRIRWNVNYFQWHFMTKSQYNVIFLFRISQLMYYKSVLADYVCEKYLEFENTWIKNIAPSNSYSTDLERVLYTCLYLATRIVLAGLLVFYQPRNKQGGTTNIAF